MRWTVEHPVYHFHYVDPKAPWYGKFIRFWTKKCPRCKCLDIKTLSNEWTVLSNGKRVRLGAIKCTACNHRWDWDTDGR